jgi:hypothetical protein
VLMTTAPHEVAPLLGLASIACLVKPFDLDDLLACVARYVRPVYSPEVVSGAPRGLVRSRKSWMS